MELIVDISIKSSSRKIARTAGLAFDQKQMIQPHFLFSAVIPQYYRQGRAKLAIFALIIG